MNNSRRLTLKSFVAVSAASALLGVGAVPAAHAAPKTVKDPTTDTVTDTTKDTKVAPGGRKVG